jgi:hypothetical protein
MNDQNITKILALGSTGMLGHNLTQVLSKTFHITGTMQRL